MDSSQQLEQLALLRDALHDAVDKQKMILDAADQMVDLYHKLESLLADWNTLLCADLTGIQTYEQVEEIYLSPSPTKDKTSDVPPVQQMEEILPAPEKTDRGFRLWSGKKKTDKG